MNNTTPPPLTAETLLDSLIGLAMRKHSNQCVFTMDSRLACSCGAELHNAKVQGVSIRLQGALAKPAPTTPDPQPRQRTIKLDDLPPPNPKDSPKFETGTSIPGIDMPLPMAQEQPAKAVNKKNK